MQPDSLLIHIWTVLFHSWRSFCQTLEELLACTSGCQFWGFSSCFISSSTSSTICAVGKERKLSRWNMASGAGIVMRRWKLVESSLTALIADKKENNMIMYNCTIILVIYLSSVAEGSPIHYVPWTPHFYCPWNSWNCVYIFLCIWCYFPFIYLLFLIITIGHVMRRGKPKYIVSTERIKGKIDQERQLLMNCLA